MSKSTTKAKSNGDETPPENSTTTEKSNVVRVKYLGHSVVTRELLDRDFKKGGLEGVGKQVWSSENNHIVEFENPQEGLIEFLTESDLLAGEFKVLDPGQV